MQPPETPHTRLVPPPAEVPARPPGRPDRPLARPAPQQTNRTRAEHQRQPATQPRSSGGPRPLGQPRPYGQPRPRRSAGLDGSRLLVLVGLAALAALGAMGYLVARELLSDDESTAVGQQLTRQPAGDDGTDDDPVTTDGSDPADGGGDPASPTPTPLVTPAGPYVRATLTGKDLVLSGVVPSQELADGVDQAAQLVYSPFVQSELTVDPQLAPTEWLAAAPRAVMLLQTISEGTITVAGGRVAVEGQAASADDVALLQARLMEATGLPVQMGDIAVLNLREATYAIVGEGGQIALSGALPSEEIRTGLGSAAAALYGTENVLDASTVDEGITPALWMYNPQGLIGTLSQFPDFELRFDDGVFAASLSGGAIYSPDSTEISPEFAQVLNFGVVVLSRDPSMTITVEGHTDAAGPDDYNLQLSQARADVVAAYFIGAGIDPERVTAIGFGETDPASPNDTEEGRSRNRRVEFALSSG